MKITFPSEIDIALTSIFQYEGSGTLSIGTQNNFTMDIPGNSITLNEICQKYIPTSNIQNMAVLIYQVVNPAMVKDTGSYEIVFSSSAGDLIASVSTGLIFQKTNLQAGSINWVSMSSNDTKV